MPDESSGTSSQRPRRGGLWWLVIAVLVISWIVMSVAPPTRTDVSYTFFTDQLNDGEVPPAAASSVRSAAAPPS